MIWLWIVLLLLLVIICYLIALQYPHHLGHWYDLVIGDPHYPYYQVPPELDYLAAASSELTEHCQQIMKDFRGNYLQRYYDGPREDFYHGWEMMVLRFSYRDYWHCYPPSPSLSYLQQLCNHPALISVSISVMAPGKHILPHRNPFPGVLRYQLPLLADDCEIIVSGVSHHYQPGVPFIFDDYLPHEVINHSSTPRWALLIDLPRPLSSSTTTFINELATRALGYLLPM